MQSRSESSMHIDNIVAGKKYDDVQKEKMLEQDRHIREKELKYKGPRDGLGVIREESKFEVES